MAEQKKKSKAPRPLSEAKGRKKASIAPKPPRKAAPPQPQSEPPQLERLHKLLAEAGVASRRSSEQLILQRRVRVNGEVVTELGSKVDPARVVISVDNKPLPQRNLKEEKLYIALHKPRGYVTTADDEQGRETVLDLLGDVGGRVYPVGRLDNNSEGLLLLTNDGDLTFRLTHPRYKVEKEYEVQTDGVPNEASLQALRTGIVLDDGIKTKLATVELLHHENGRAWLRFVISEGRKRQIRNMLEAVGHPTRRLIRTRIGPLKLGDLKRGEHRNLTPGEVYALHKAVGLEAGTAPNTTARPAGPTPRRTYSDKSASRPGPPAPAAHPSRFTHQGEGGEAYQPERPQRSSRPAPLGGSRPFPVNGNPTPAKRGQPAAPTGRGPARSSRPAPSGGNRPFPINGNPAPAKRGQPAAPGKANRPASPFGHPSRPARSAPSGSRPPAGGKPQRGNPSRGKRER
jgi:23S rRNA pseudouridine2605 synthase